VDPNIKPFSVLNKLSICPALFSELRRPQNQSRQCDSLLYSSCRPRVSSCFLLVATVILRQVGWLGLR